MCAGAPAATEPALSVPGALARGWRGDALALGAGALLTLAFAPVGLYPLAPLVLAVLATVWSAAGAGRAAWRGLLFGLGQHGVGASWIFVSIERYGNTGVAVAGATTLVFVLYLAAYPALLGYLWRRLFPAGGTVALVAALPAGWVLLEWWRGWFLSGFPWPDLGYSQIDGPLAGLAPLVGVYGLSWAVALSGALLVLVTRARRRVRAWALAAGSVLWLGSAALGTVVWTSPAGAPLRVSLIQGNVEQSLKWDPRRAASILETYRTLSESEWGREIILWPETAVPHFLDEVEEGYLRELRRRGEVRGTELVLGIPVRDRDAGAYYNGVAVLGPRPAVYRKRHLVPFGEYFPFRAALRGLNILQVPMADFSAGDAEQVLPLIAGHPVGISICYEVAYGGLIRVALPRAAFLVTVSNDGWFGDSLGPHQHLQIARLRALEMGRFMLRATNTGITAVIGPDGAVRARAEQFRAGVLRAEITPLLGATPFARWGSAPVLACLAGVVLAAPMASRRRRAPSRRPGG